MKNAKIAVIWGVKGHPRSSERLLFDRVHTISYSTLIDFNSIDFKIGVLVYRCLHGLAPLYLTDYFERVADTNRRRLRSSSSSFLAVRRTRLSTVGDRAFPVIGSRFWNTLPDSVISAPSLSVFRSRLKSHLFERSLPADSY